MIYSLFYLKIFALSNGAVSLRSLPSTWLSLSQTEVPAPFFCNKYCSFLKYCSFEIFYNTSSATFIALFSSGQFLYQAGQKCVPQVHLFFGNSYCSPSIETDVKNWIFSQICLIPLWAPHSPIVNTLGKSGKPLRFGHNFWLGGPIDLRSTLLNCILQDLFRDTPTGHIYHTEMRAPTTVSGVYWP